jgi:hypothetical protein
VGRCGESKGDECRVCPKPDETRQPVSAGRLELSARGQGCPGQRQHGRAPDRPVLLAVAGSAGVLTTIPGGRRGRCSADLGCRCLPCEKTPDGTGGNSYHPPLLIALQLKKMLPDSQQRFVRRLPTGRLSPPEKDNAACVFPLHFLAGMRVNVPWP